VGAGWVAKRILWLRGDPEAIRELKSRLWLLRPQGVYVTFDPASQWDVAVMPLPESPESKVFSVVQAKGPAVSDEDPLRALLLALAYPKDGFSTLRIGVDPGQRLCGLAAVADGLIIEARSVTCDEVAERAERLVRAAPAARFSLVLGSGSGWEEVASRLLEKSLSFTVADEMGTTNSAADLLPLRLRDRNARAAVRLALLQVVNH